MSSGHVRPPFLAALVLTTVLGVGVLAFLVVSPNGNAQPTPTPSPTFWDQQNRSVRPPRLAPSAPCRPIHFDFNGNPRKFGTQMLGRFRIPRGRTWHITNATVMLERHDGEGAVGGEWTAVVGAVHGVGSWPPKDVTRHRVPIMQTTMDTGGGRSVGQGATDVLLVRGDHLTFTIWLRPGSIPQPYFYSLGASGMNCPT